MDVQQIFAELVENAFDFLDHSIAQFEASPKHAVINFHAAVELFFKARLFREHWAQVLSDPGRANWDKFIQGRFRSVGIADANERLVGLVKDGVGGAESRCFDNLTDHRNRMVHFFHNGQKDKTQLEQVVSELCHAWYYLKGILTHQWKSHFAAYEERLSQIDGRMHKYRKFLESKFQIIQDQIKGAKTAGRIIRQCPACEFVANVTDVSDQPVFDSECLVCNLKDWGIELECPECDSVEYISGDCWKMCSNCDFAFNDDKVRSIVEHNTTVPGDVEDVSRGSCADCDGTDSLVKMKNDKWLCVHCFVCHDADEVTYCGWCNTPGAGVSEFSGFAGCPACPGSKDYYSD